MNTALTPTVAIHLSAALGALLLGPLALWSRLGREQHPQLHRWAGRLWVALMLTTAITAMGIRHSSLAIWQGFSLIHLLIPLTLVTLVVAVIAVLRGHIRRHRRSMQSLYLFALLIPGAFTLLPGRYLGRLVWGDWLGWL